MKTKIKISRKTLLAINTFRSTDECRYTLNGICLEVTKAGRCRVLATDGRRFGGIEDGEVLEAPEKSGQVVFKLNEPLLKALPKSDTVADDVVISVDGLKIEFSAFGSNDKTKFEVEAMEGTFPKWRQVIPKGEQPLPVDPCFNWRLLGGFTKAADILQSDRTAAIQIRQKENEAMLVLIPSKPNFVGVLMPMRIQDANKAPEWTVSEDLQ